MTLRLRADSGKIPVTWVGRERRFSSIDVEAMTVSTGSECVRLEGLYVRVSGSSGQESSLGAQEMELRATSTGEIVKVFRDRASGLREDRPGLNRLLRAVADGSVTVVHVSHEDRLARFGVGWLGHLLAVYGADLRSMEARAWAAPTTPACRSTCAVRSPTACTTWRRKPGSPWQPFRHATPPSTARTA
ncbi:recombinase family protein [Streptomyces sp. TLI_55]|uniref:recombinase family protein n=1 Tax=Streptomyces sp. TLI_55 TaxID=1938861 RepID=UPI001C53AB1F|nr:recombinase family protein [Streptomyces sp. TLI_55]